MEFLNGAVGEVGFFSRTSFGRNIGPKRVSLRYNEHAAVDVKGGYLSTQEDKNLSSAQKSSSNEEFFGICNIEDQNRDLHGSTTYKDKSPYVENIDQLCSSDVQLFNFLKSSGSSSQQTA